MVLAEACVSLFCYHRGHRGHGEGGQEPGGRDQGVSAESTPLLAARVTVRLREPALGIGAGLHMSTAWAVDEDWSIVEPTTGLTSRLAEYEPEVLRHHTQ